jgi:hypothetical protein
MRPELGSVVARLVGAGAPARAAAAVIGSSARQDLRDWRRTRETRVCRELPAAALPR